MVVATAAAGLAVVSGMVWLRHGEESRPAARAWIEVRTAESGVLLGRAQTDRQGRYRVEDLPPERVILRAVRPGCFTRAPASQDGVLVLDLAGVGEFPNADFEAYPGGVVTGVVTDASGEPMERVTVAALRGRFRAASASTDDRGEYRIYGLEPGTYHVTVVPRRDHAFAARVEVAAGTDTKRVDIVLPRADDEVLPQEEPAPPEERPAGPGSGTVSGTVRVPHSRVGLAPAGAPQTYRVQQSDQRGRFLFRGVSPGGYVVCAWTPADRSESCRRPRRFSVEPGVHVELELSITP